MRFRQLSIQVSAAVLLLVSVQPLLAGDRGSLIVRVNPPETYIYADGQPVYWSKGHYITLLPGTHKISLYNYGYSPETRTVTIEARKTTTIDVTMQAVPGTVNGPWGCITIEGPHGAAVLLNGKEPAESFVGNIKEFDNELLWKKELIVPPGTHQLTIADALRPSWTTAVEVKPNQRVVVDAYKGVRKTVAWKRGERLEALSKFKGGTLNYHVAVEKVTGLFSSSTEQISCGQTAHLTWSAKGATKVELNGAPVSASGDQTVQPTQSTDYKFTAVGPGGVYTSAAKVNVDNSIQASLNVSPGELRYNGNGQPSMATVTWSAPNADSVSLDPLGSVGANGSREVPITPSPSSSGAINQTVTYTLRASNSCGGSETRIATLHITGNEVLQGSTDESTLQTKLNSNSVYFPTDWPTIKDPDGGLVPSQASRVEANASDFKQYLVHHPEAKLILEAYCDVRGSVAYNQALAERRASEVKNYLVQHGIAADQIETKAYGKTKQLTGKQVEDLTAENPDATPAERKRVQHELVVFQWANNRRVDIRLSTTGELSRQFYPFDSSDLNVLLGTKEPAKQTASMR